MLTDTIPWDSLEQRSSDLFFLASVILLVAAIHRGSAFVLDGFAFNYWLGLTSVLGRLAALLGVAGLSVQIATRNARLGNVGRAVVSLAVVFAVGLLALGILENAGFSTPVIAVFGLGTFLLSVIAFLCFGLAVVRTGAYSTLVGSLLLAAAVALLVVFFGQQALPEHLIGAVIEGVLFGLYLGIGYRLRTERAPGRQADPAADATP